jgi:hypothetical protein
MKVYIIEEVVRMDNSFDSSIKYVSTNLAVAEQLKAKAEQEMHDMYSSASNYEDFSINMQIWESTDSLQVDDSLKNAIDKYMSDLLHAEYPAYLMGRFYTYDFIDDLQLDNPKDERYVVECSFGRKTDADNEKHTFTVTINKSTLEIKEN